MLQTSITYFDSIGPENTRPALTLAIETARALGIKTIVFSTTKGRTAQIMADEMDCTDLQVIAVTHAYGQKEPGTNPMPESLRKELMEKGLQLCTAAHTLSGVERCLSGMFGGVYPVEVIAHTLRMFGQGTKVCVEICAMAADAGLIPAGQPVVAVGGTGSGADTVIVLRPEVSSKLLKTKIDRIVCKPIES